MTLRFLSVCSGIEAASVAWGGLGWEASGFSEIEPFPSAVLAHHYPNVPNHGDMTKIAGKVASFEIEAPDMLVGGTPCQAFSVAGLRNGLSDRRGQLTLSFVEIADAIDSARFIRGQQPAIVVWENVPGVLSSKDNAFGCFLGALAGEGCELQPSGGRWANAGCVFGPKRAIAWRILDAQYFGVAQRRRRVFVVASARNGFDPAKVLFEFDGVRRDSPPSREPWESAAAGAGRSSADSRKWPADIASCLNAHFGDKQGLEDQHINQGAPLFAPAAFSFDSISSNSMKSNNPNSGCRAVDVAKTLDTTVPCPSKNQGGIGVLSYGIPGNWINRKPENGGNAVEPMRNIAPCLTKTDQHGVAHYPVYSTHPPCIGRAPNDGAAYCMDSRGQPQAVAFGVAESPHLAHCLRSGASKADKHESTTYVTQHMAVRRLTPVECERLQGFPDTWTQIPWRKKPAEECPDGPRYKALGNSMAVPVMAWIGKRIDREVSNEKTL